jgi:hypothetical protein
MTARHVITAILMLLAKAVAAQLANEIPLSPPIYGPVNVTNVAKPFTASDGTNFLVAWLDGRMAGSPTIYANRVTRLGELLDGTGIRVPNDPGNPAAAPYEILGLFHVDGVYTLFYRHSDQSYPVYPIATYAVIIGDDGRILEGPRQVFTSSVGRMASNGSRIVALIGNDIFVLNGHAEVINRFPLPVFAGGNPFNAAIGSNGSTFLLVRFGSIYNSSSGYLYFADLLAFDTSGQFSSATRVNDVNGSGGVIPLVQSDGTDYLVVCFRSVLSVSAQAELRSKSDLILSQFVETPALSWTGQMYLLAAAARDNTQQMAVLTLARDGSAIGSVRKIEPEAQRSFTPAMATNGTEALVAWMSQPSGTVTVRAAVVDGAGTPHSPVMTLPTASNVQSHAVIATGGLYDLAVWEEADGMYATRVTSTGSPLDGRGILVAQKPAAQSAGTFQPRVVFDGTAYLVAWGPGSVRGQRIDPATGRLLDTPVTLASCAGSFDLESDGKSPVLFVAGCDPQLYAQRVDAIGTAGPRVSIFPAGTSLSHPRASWNGYEWLVVWQENRGGLNAYFGRVSSELTPLDSMPILDPAPPFYDQSPSAASDGHDLAVVVTRYGRGMYFRNMHSDGTAGEATLLAPNAQNASLVWDGSQYAVLYAETCTTPCRPRSYLSHFRIQADQPVVTDKVPIAESAFTDGTLEVLGNGSVRMVYTRNAIEPLYGSSPRVFLRDDYASVPRRRAAGR